MKAFSRYLAIASLLAATTVRADPPVVITVALVEYIGGGTKQLIVQDVLGGVNYYAQENSPGCSLSANNADTIKIWQSLATSALLSGKSLRIYFTTCSSVKYITAIDLNRT